MIRKVWTFAGYNIFEEVEKELEEKTDKGWHLVVSSSLFIKQKHKCLTWEQYRKKSQFNKWVEKLRKIFNKEEYAVFD